VKTQIPKPSQHPLNGHTEDKFKLTTTKIGNLLRKYEHGDNSMFRKGFFEGANWAVDARLVGKK
jgi:hypothetical protein